MDVPRYRSSRQFVREFLTRRLSRRDLARSLALATFSARVDRQETSPPQPGGSRDLHAGPEASGLRDVMIIHDDPNEKNGFRISHRSAWGDSQSVVTMASHGGMPPIHGEYDLDVGDLNGYLRKIDFRVSAGVVDRGVVYGPSRVSSVQQPNTTTFTDSRLPAAANQYVPSKHESFVVVFTSGANAGKRRWIATSGSGTIVCGAPFLKPIAAGDSYEIHRLAIPHAASSPQLTIWHGTDDTGNTLPYVCFDVVESLPDQGARHRFEPKGATFRDYLAVVPSGTRGVYDLHVGAESGIWRDLVFETNGLPNALRLLQGAKRWEFSAGVNFPSRDLTATTDLEADDVFVYGDASAGAFSIRLPDPSLPGLRNGVLFIKNRGRVNDVTIVVRGASNTIDGLPAKSLAPGAALMVHARSTSDYASFAM